MLDPAESLKLLAAGFTPIQKGDDHLIYKDFDKLTQISDLFLGSIVKLSGQVTHVSGLREKDGDIHFDLAPSDGNGFVVCEIQNADVATQGQPLQEAIGNANVEVTGLLRIFLEHVYESKDTTLPHLFEIHPVGSVKIDGKPLGGITMDCPGQGDFAKQGSVYKIQIQDDGTMTRTVKGGKQRTLNDNIPVKFDGNDLIIWHPPYLNTNYVWTSAHFVKTDESSFQDGEPYVFELRGSTNEAAIGIRSAIIPDTPAYEKVKALDANPPGRRITAAVLRSLNISALRDDVYEVVFCPVYRIT